MGLFGNNYGWAKKGVAEMKKNAKRVMVICPMCRERFTVVFHGKGDSFTCKNCRYKIYASELGIY